MSPGWQAFLCQYFFSRQFVLFSNFHSLSRPPCWPLTSRLLFCLFLCYICLPGLSLCTFGLWLPPFLYHPIWQGPKSDSLTEINLMISTYPYQSVSPSPVTASCVSCWLGLGLCPLARCFLLFLRSPFALERSLPRHPSGSTHSLLLRTLTIIIRILPSSVEHATRQQKELA